MTPMSFMSANTGWLGWMEKTKKRWMCS